MCAERSAGRGRSLLDQFDEPGKVTPLCSQAKGDPGQQVLLRQVGCQLFFDLPVSILLQVAE
jgi:hypothetical protein